MLNFPFALLQRCSRAILRAVVSDLFFFGSKIFGRMVSPLGMVLSILGLAAFLLLRKGERIPGLLILAAIGLILAAGNPIVSGSLLRSLESRNPLVPAELSPDADAIVLLGGGLAASNHPNGPLADLNDSGDRVLRAWRLFKAGKAPWLITTGGMLFDGESQVSQAEFAARLLYEMGIPRGKILQVPGVRNTYEEAQAGRILMVDRKLTSVLLVTSAFHMPRAAAVFRSANVEVIPSPADFRSFRQHYPLLLSLIPNTEAFNETSLAFKEYLGMGGYWLKGWIR